MPVPPALPARYGLSGEVLRIARRCALDLGLPPESAEDCAMAFVGRMLLDDDEAVLRPPDRRCLVGSHNPAWLYWCARNHARSFRRRILAIAAHEQPWFLLRDAEEYETLSHASGVAPDPGAVFMRGVASQAVRTSIMQLAPGPREVFLLYHVEGCSIGEIASSSGRSPHAVEQCLVRTRRRLRVLLERQGLTAGELRFHFAKTHGASRILSGPSLPPG